MCGITREFWELITMCAFDALTYASYMAYIERHSSQFTSFLTSYSIIAFYHLIFSFSSVCHFPCHLLPLLLFFFFFCLPLSVFFHDCFLYILVVSSFVILHSCPLLGLQNRCFLDFFHRSSYIYAKHTQLTIGISFSWSLYYFQTCYFLFCHKTG